MTRPTDMETTAIVKTVYYSHRSEKKGACHGMGGLKGSTRVGQEAEAE